MRGGPPAGRDSWEVGSPSQRAGANRTAPTAMAMLGTVAHVRLPPTMNTAMAMSCTGEGVGKKEELGKAEGDTGESKGSIVHSLSPARPVFHFLPSSLPRTHSIGIHCLASRIGCSLLYCDLPLRLNRTSGRATSYDVLLHLI